MLPSAAPVCPSPRSSPSSWSPARGGGSGGGGERDGERDGISLTREGTAKPEMAAGGGGGDGGGVAGVGGNASAGELSAGSKARRMRGRGNPPCTSACSFSHCTSAKVDTWK